jgi:4-hydroxy-tetrahydrodipicolinate synthase
MRIEGVFVAVTSPFDSEGKFSAAVFESHLEWLAESGVNGFVPCGTTGESPVLTRNERALMISASCRIASKKSLRVIAGCGSNSTAAALEMLQEAKGLGCHAGLVVTPYYNRPTQRGLIAHYETLADRSELPLVLYNVPGRTNVNITPETAGRLLRHPQIIGIKEASGQWSQWLELSHATDLNSRSFLAGDDNAFAAILALGGTGIISACANVSPHSFVALYRAAKAGNWSEAFYIQKKINPLVQSLFLETSPAPIKFALKYLNKIPGFESHLRLPLVPVETKTEAAVVAALESLEATVEL